ncbi:hypothetical protein DL96DRAFT_1557201 [Flagelloscypha sp. PMI_526]|nr:hypothetical protein DL96DRAFT_1557201 [Flagelloscypha sp. PMI_526]
MLSDFYTICLLYIPSALFLLVVRILDVVNSDAGVWLGVRTATRIIQQPNKGPICVHDFGRDNRFPFHLFLPLWRLQYLIMGVPLRFFGTSFTKGLDFGLLLLEHLLLNFGQITYINVVPWPALVVVNVSERLLISLLLAFRICDIVQFGAQARDPFNLVPSYDIRSSRMALLLGRDAWENLSLRLVNHFCFE